MNYTHEDVIREKAELATCLHEEVDDWTFEGLDGSGLHGTLSGKCVACEAEVECDASYTGTGHDRHSAWRLA